MIEALETKHFVNAAGEYLGGFGGVRKDKIDEWPDVPEGAIEVPGPPGSLLDRFVDGAWVPPGAAVVEAERLKQARARISENAEMAALIGAVSARLSIPADDLVEDVVSSLVRRR